MVTRGANPNASTARFTVAWLCFTSPLRDGRFSKRGDGPEGFGELVDGERRSRADVEGAAQARRLAGADVRLRHVGDVDEVARLLAVAVDQERLPIEQAAGPDRHHVAVRVIALVDAI